MENERYNYQHNDAESMGNAWHEDESTLSRERGYDRSASRWEEFDDHGTKSRPSKKKKGSGKKFRKGLGITLLILLIVFNTGTSLFLLHDHMTAEDVIVPVGPQLETAKDDNLSQTAKDGEELTVSQINHKVSPAVVLITSTGMRGGGQGTGFIISEDGYIMTNAHVVSGFSEIVVTLNDDARTEYPATVIGEDATTDIAVIRIQAKGLPTVELGSSSNLEVGQDVVVIGNPLGEDFSGSVTTGIISALDRKVEFEDGQVYEYIQTDAAINTGNSGGPLMNMQGQVIGVNAAKIDSSVAEGMGFAIPIDTAVPVANDLIQYGYVTNRPYIGIGGESLSEQISAYYNLPAGVHVTAVTEGGPADQAGIHVDDIVTAINGVAVTSVGQINSVKNDYKPGDTVELTVYRYATGKSFTAKVVLGEMAPEMQ